MHAQTDRRSKWRRALRWGLAAPLLLWVIYLAAANFLLSSSAGRSLMNRKPEKLTVQWHRAWTWFPGVVHVRGLDLEGRARRAQWSAQVDRGRMAMWLPSLFGRHFRLMRGKTEGAEIQVRVTPPPETPRPPAKRRGWRVSLERIAVDDLRVLELNEHRLEGPGNLRGAARFQVRGPVELAFEEFTIPQGRLLSGGEVAADPLELSSSLTIEPFVVGEDTAEDILASTSGSLVLDAQADSLGFLATYLGSVPWLELGGSGHLTADVEATSGWLAPGSQLEVEGPHVRASFFGLVATGQGRIEGRVPEGTSRAELVAVLDRFDMERSADQIQLLRGTGLTVKLLNDTAAFDRPASGITLDFDLPPASIPDLSALAAYLPEGIGIDLVEGSAELSARMHYDSIRKAGNGSLDLAIADLEATVQELGFTGQASLAARFPHADLDAGVLDLTGTELDLEQVTIRGSKRPREEDWWGRFKVTEGHVKRIAGEPPTTHLDSRVTASLRDTGPIVSLIEQRTPKLAWFDRLLTVTGVEAFSELEVVGERVDLSDLRVTGGRKGRLELLGELALEEKTTTGVFFARWGKLSAAVALEEGERDWKLLKSRSWYDRQVAERDAP